MTRRSVIIIGMGPGNGRAIAERFGREGYALGLVARTPEPLRAQADALRATGYDVAFEAVDTRDLSSIGDVIARLEATLGPVDVLAFNAYAAAPAAPSELAPTQLLEDLSVNAAAPLAAAQAVLPGMRARGGGAILFTGGGLALHPTMHAASLSVGKSAIRTLAFVLNEELKPQGVRVGTVTIAGAVGSDINAADVADAFWALASDRAGEMSAETVLTPGSKAHG